MAHNDFAREGDTLKNSFLEVKKVLFLYAKEEGIYILQTGTTRFIASLTSPKSHFGCVEVKI
jgi:hypothetical protein